MSSYSHRLRWATHPLQFSLPVPAAKDLWWPKLVLHSNPVRNSRQFHETVLLTFRAFCAPRPPKRVISDRSRPGISVKGNASGGFTSSIEVSKLLNTAELSVTQ